MLRGCARAARPCVCALSRHCVCVVVGCSGNRARRLSGWEQRSRSSARCSLPCPLHGGNPPAQLARAALLYRRSGRSGGTGRPGRTHSTHAAHCPYIYSTHATLQVRLHRAGPPAPTPVSSLHWCRLVANACSRGLTSQHFSADPSLAQPWQRGRLQRPAAVLRQPLLSYFSVVAHRAGARVRGAALLHRLYAARTLA